MGGRGHLGGGLCAVPQGWGPEKALELGEIPLA